MEKIYFKLYCTKISCDCGFSTSILINLLPIFISNLRLYFAVYILGIFCAIINSLSANF